MKHKQSEFDAAAIEQIEACIGYTFQNKGLLRQAFTRSSYRNEHPWEPDNEVLELIGDSVLSLSVLTYFKETYARNTEKGLLTDWDEGRLSALKNALDLGNKILQMGSICHHFGGDAVNLFGLLPLLFVVGLDQSIHNDLSATVGNGNRQNFIVRINARQFKIEEQYAFALHMVMRGTVQVSLGAANGKILGKAVLAHLAAVTHVFAATHTH